VHIIGGDVTTKGDPICKAANAQLAALSTKDYPAYLHKGLAILQNERQQLGRIQALPADQAQYNLYLSLLDQTIADVAKAVQQLPNTQKAQLYFTVAATPAQKARNLAGLMGFFQCGSPHQGVVPVPPTTG
jgi:hypothetical protein